MFGREEEMLKISVAMATYNGESYIKEQLVSLAEQIRRPDEVIIADDCSQDSTVDIIKEFIAERELPWKLVEGKTNLGFKKNFRKALSLTTGDVVFLCDQDDVWCEDKIECISGVFADNPQALAVNSSFTVIDGEGFAHPLDKSRGKNNYGMLPKISGTVTRVRFKDVFHRNISPGCTMAARGELVREYVRLTECALPHDWELNLMAASRQGLFFCNAPLIKYRIHDSNAIGLAVKPQSRTDIAKEKAAAAMAVKKYSGRGGLYAFCDRRYRALERSSLTGVLGLWFCGNYYHFFPLRERIGDILYIFGRK